MGHHDRMSRHITSAEAARISGRSRSQINRDAAEGKLPSVSKFPGHRGPRLFDERVVREVYGVAS